MNPMKYFIISFSIVIVVLLFSALVVKNAVLTFNVGIWGLILSAVPAMFMSYMEYRKILHMEEQFPRFLRDFSEAVRSGLPVIEAFKKTAEGNYGELTHELRRVRNALQWNVPFEKALERMRKRLSVSDKLNKIIAIIIQTYKSGADISNILFSLSRDIETIREIENEKKALLFRHVMMMYAIFFIFLFIVIMLLRFISPIIASASTGQNFRSIGLGFGNDPCSLCSSYMVSPECMACGIFKGTANKLGFSSGTSQLAYYKGLMFWMIIVQAIFSGMVSGFIESSNLSSSMKHSSIMLVIGFLVYYIANMAGVV